MHWMFWVLFILISAPLAAVLVLAYLFWSRDAAADVWRVIVRPRGPRRYGDLNHETDTWLIVHGTALALMLILLLPGMTEWPV